MKSHWLFSRAVSAAVGLVVLVAGCSTPGTLPPTTQPSGTQMLPAPDERSVGYPALNPATATLETIKSHPAYASMVKDLTTPDSQIVFVDPGEVTLEWMNAGKYPKGTVVLPKSQAGSYQVQGHWGDGGGGDLPPNCDFNHQQVAPPGGPLSWQGTVYGAGSWWNKYTPEATYLYWLWAPNAPRTDWEWWLLTTCWNGPRPSAPPSTSPSPGGSGAPSPTPTPCPSGPVSLTFSEFLSPNGDGRMESASGTVTAPGDWELVVEGLGKVKSGTGSQAITWNGKSESGALVADGTRTVTLKTCAGSDTKKIVVDTQNPTVSDIKLVPGEPVEGSSSFTLKGSARLSDVGAAGIKPSSVEVKALGAEVTGVSEPEVAADGSSVTFTVTVTPVDIRKAYRISAVSQINILTQVSVEDNAGNNIGGEVNFSFDSPSSGLANAAGNPGEKVGHALFWRRMLQEIVIYNGVHKVFDPDSHDSPSPVPSSPADYDRVLDEILATAMPTNKKSPKIYEKGGGYSQAVADFKKLAGHLQPSTNEPNRMVVDIPGWATINVRNYSTQDGLPTLELQFPAGRKNIKIRYPELLS